MIKFIFLLIIIGYIEFEETRKPAELIDLLQKLKQSLREAKIKNVS